MTRESIGQVNLPGLDSAAPKLGPTGRPLRTFAGPPCAQKARTGAHHRPVQPEGRRRQDDEQINLGATFAEYGRRVLAIDFDPQGALSAGLGVPTHDVTTIYDLLLSRTRDPCRGHPDDRR